MTSISNKKNFRQLAVYGIVYFSITMLLTVIFIVPKFKDIIQTPYIENHKTNLAYEAELFTRLIEREISLLEDLARLPSVTSAAILSDSTDPVLVNLFGNLVIGGKTGRVVLQDSDGKVVIQSSQMLQGSYGSNDKWVQQIINNEIPYYFQLLDQNIEYFKYRISIPVRFDSYPKGALSAEFTSSLEDIFPALDYNENIAFKLSQGSVTVITETEYLENVREESLRLENINVDFTYIVDQSAVVQKENSIRNLILLVLFCGLIISFFVFSIYGYHEQKNRNILNSAHHSSFRIYTLPVLVFFTGVAASAIAFNMINKFKQEDYDKELIFNSKTIIDSISDTLKANLEVLDSVKAYFDTSDDINRSDFEYFVRPLLKNNPNIKAIAWVPRVTLPNRALYEELARQDGLTEYKIRELSSVGKIVAAETRDQYFPVFYAEPVIGNELAFGFDLASNASRYTALINASRTGLKVATAPIQLVDEPMKGTAILVFYPIYETYDDIKRDDTSKLRGYAQLVLRTEQLIGDTVNVFNDKLALHIQDTTSQRKPVEVFGNTIAEEKIMLSENIAIGTRLWRVNVSHVEGGSPLQWISWLVLFTGVLLSVIMTTGLVNLLRRREVVEVLVKERTKELNMFSLIAANANDSFIVTHANHKNFDTGDQEVIYVNEAFLRTTGFKKEEIVGRNHNFFKGRNVSDNDVAVIAHTLKQGEIYTGEMLYHTKYDDEYWAEVSIIPLLNESGDVIQYASIQRDITERKKAEVEKEKLIGELVDSNAELERFAYVCSHDMQEPLRMIRSFSEKLQNHLGSKLQNDEKGKKYFGYIVNGASRSQELITDILNYSLINNDPKLLQRVSAQEIVKNIVDQFDTVISNGDAKITYDTLPELQGNKTQLYQLFQNLVNNAVKYQHPNNIAHVHISVHDVGEFWQFSVKDNGLGIKEQHIGKIFDVFQRLHRQSQYAGTGIGLSICKKIVSRHGGTLWVESTFGEGSTFHFTLLKPTPVQDNYDEQRKAS